MHRLTALSSFLCLIFFWSGALCAYADVVLFDNVTTVHSPVFLKVLTRKIFFPEGGCLVDIYEAEQKIGQILTGGDGYGFLKVTPQTSGLKTFQARQQDGSDSAVLLVLKPTGRALLVEVESLGRTLFSISGAVDAREALNTLNQRFGLIYLTRWIGVQAARQIILKEAFPPSAVLEWPGRELLKDLKGRHVALSVLIGSAALISETGDAVSQRFTFDATDDGTHVETWQDLLRKLP